MPGSLYDKQAAAEISTTDGTATIVMYDRLDGAARAFIAGDERQINCGLILQAVLPTVQKSKQVDMQFIQTQGRSKSEAQKFKLDLKVYNLIAKSAENFAHLAEQLEDGLEEESDESESEDKKPPTKITGAKKGKKNEGMMEEEMSIDDEPLVKGRSGVKDNKGKSHKKEVTTGPDYKKGKYNRLVNLVTACEQLEGKNNKPNLTCSMRNTNRDIIRAAMTGNRTLLRTLLDSDMKISTAFPVWGVDNKTNPLIEIIKRHDMEMLDQLLSKSRNTKKPIELGSLPDVSIEQKSTGFNDKYAYGVYTRKVNMSRGGRQGNNAFIEEDDEDINCESYQFIEMLFALGNVDSKLIKRILIHAGSYERQLLQHFDQALMFGNPDACEHLLKFGIKNGYGCTEPYLSALKGDRGSVETIPKQSVIKKAYSIKNLTPIHVACLNPNPEVLPALLHINPELQVLDSERRKAIHYAACNQSSANLLYLLEQFMDPNEHDNSKTTPLMYAAKAGSVACVKALLEENRANVKTKNRKGYSPIHFAAEYGHHEIIQLLVNAGIKISLGGPDRMSPLHIAAAKGDLDTVRFLVENGAKVTAKDKYKRAKDCTISHTNNYGAQSCNDSSSSTKPRSDSSPHSVKNSSHSDTPADRSSQSNSDSATK